MTAKRTTRCTVLAGVLALLPSVALAQQAESVVTAEAPIVARNAVLAKQRALADAFRQAVERAFVAVIAENAETAKAPLTPGLAQLKASFAVRGQRFIRSYRVLEQDDSGGRLRLQIEADVDTALLRREMDRARGSGAADAVVGQAAPVAASFLVGGNIPLDVRVIAVNALQAAGARVQGSTVADDSQLLAAAAGQGSQAVVIAATSTSEGPVRGTSRISVRCEMRARVLRPQAGTGPRGPALERSAEQRGFDADEPGSRLTCLERAGAALARDLVAALRPAPVTSRYVTLELDTSEPGALYVVLQGIKRMGAVSSSELRHLTNRQAEVRLHTRLAGPSIESGLIRELAGRVSMVVQKPATADRVSLQVRTIQVGDVPTPEPSP